MNLLEFDPELPPCFKAWCDCGWRGRVLNGFAYVIGTNVPVEGLEKEYLCPSCKKGSPWSFSSKFHSSVEEGDFEKRFRWVMENRGVQLVRGDELFPCTCEVRPNCRIVDKIVVSACIVGDTAFQCDQSWMRA